MLNKVLIVGRLGKEPEVKFSQAGNAMANFNVATNEGYKDKSGQWMDKTEWHRVATFGKTAEYCGRLNKGCVVFVEGKLSSREWNDQQGQKHSITEIVAARVRSLKKKSSDTPSRPAPVESDAPFDMEQIPF